MTGADPFIHAGVVNDGHQLGVKALHFGVVGQRVTVADGMDGRPLPLQLSRDLLMVLLLPLVCTTRSSQPGGGR